MKRIIEFFKRKKKENTILENNFKKSELPIFFTERKIEKIYLSAFPGNKFGQFSNFFDFKYSYNLILFLDESLNSTYQDYYEKNFTNLKEKFSEKGRNFIKVPDTAESTEFIDYKYFFPDSSIHFKDFNNIRKEMYENLDQSVLRFLGYQGTIKTGFLSVYERQIVFVEKLEHETIEEFVINYIKNLGTKVKEEKVNIFYSIDNKDDPKRKEPPIEIDESTEKIVEEIQLKVQRLVETGNFFLVAPFMEMLLNQSILINAQPSSIKITSDFRIFLTNYDLEIKMNHLTKAIYFLFLKEEKPIDLNNLQQYKIKLLNLYKHISYKNSLDDMEESVDALLSPESDLIYMHLSRIKSAFIKKIDSNFAMNYYIIGTRGKPKYINLSKDLIIWEEDF
jgi:hypothetical protein